MHPRQVLCCELQEKGGPGRGCPGGGSSSEVAPGLGWQELVPAVSSVAGQLRCPLRGGGSRGLDLWLDLGSSVAAQLPFIPGYILNMGLIAFPTNQLNTEYPANNFLSWFVSVSVVGNQ